MIKLFEKMFLGGEWAVALKRKNETAYKVLQEDCKEYWLADPFMYKYNDKNYLFCEAYMKASNKGVIRVFEINEDLTLNDLGNIIEQNYHMSYPQVFEMDNEIYMIPESSGNRTIELYKCIEFPMKWEKQKELINNIYAVDSNTVIVNNQLYLVTYVYEKDIPYLQVYRIDKRWNLELIKNEQYIENTGRGAGNFIVKNNMLIRPTQNQKIKYGESVYFKKCKIGGENIYVETIDSEMNVSNTKIKGKNVYKRIHTYNCMGDLEVIDVRSEKFDGLLMWKKMKRRLYNNQA